MSSISCETLRGKHCTPCEGGVPTLTSEQAVEHLTAINQGWKLTPDGQRIRREWTARDFVTAIGFINKVAELAEAEGHHPDLHLTCYRKLMIEIWTHAIGGLSENDFILAAKIDQIPIRAKD
jgi:4a-hydroxytetrahydrobiopterin dehydratase